MEFYGIPEGFIVTEFICVSGITKVIIFKTLIVTNPIVGLVGTKYLLSHLESLQLRKLTT